MKKYGLIILGSFLILSACGKDEPANGNTSKIQSNAVFKTDNGDRVVCSKIGDTEMFYNDKGLPIRVGDYIFDYDDMVFYDIDNTNRKYKFTLNSSGCITSITDRYVYSDGDVVTRNWSLTYDESTHLTEYKYSSVYLNDDEGVKHTDTYSGVWTITWANNKVTKLQFKDKDYCDKSKHLDEDSSTCIPVYYEQNRLGQFTDSYADLLDIEYYEEFTLAGLFGKAPAYLPSKLTWTYIYKCSEDDDSESGYYSYDYDYSFNADGTIAREYYTYEDDEGYNYSNSFSYYYMPFGTRAGSVFDTIDMSKSSITSEPRKTHHKRHIKEKIECRKKQKAGSI